MARRTTMALLLLLLPGCAGAPVRRARAGSLDVPELLLEYAGRRTFFLQRPRETRVALEGALESEHGPGRLEPLTMLAMAALWDAEGRVGQSEHSQLLQKAAHAAREASRWTGDPRLKAELALVDLWVLFRTERPDAAAVAARLARTSDASPTVGSLALFIRAESVFGLQQFERAASYYRWLLGDVDGPLYSLALYRTAECYRALGRDAEARQVLTDIVSLGRRRGASFPTPEVAAAASADLETH